MRASDIAKVTLLRRPDITVPVFISVCANGLMRALAHVASHLTAYAAVTAVSAAGVYAAANVPETGAAADFVNGSIAAVYWILLGVLSSIGLGSGLHTFLLFLGPFIARVASEAIAQGSTAFSARIIRYFTWPSSWDMEAFSKALTPVYEANAFTASTPPAEAGVSVLAIASLVALPAFYWGLGTAIGELPPYFIARAAARAGEALEELQEVDELEQAGSSQSQSLLSRAKVAVYEAVQKYGFVAILLAASVPNPFFDLAGMTCGFMGISFYTFFLATFIGKAVIKVSLQVFFVIFSAKYGSLVFDSLLAWPALQSVPLLYAQLTNVHATWMKSRYNACARMGDCVACCEKHFQSTTDLNECHAACNVTSAPDSSLLSQAWGMFILVTVLFFVISIVNAAVQERLLHDAAVAAVATPSRRSHVPVHVHGAQLVSALVNADELGGAASPASDWRAPAGLGDPEPHFVAHTRILNKSQRLSTSPARKPRSARKASPSPSRSKRAVATIAVAAAASKRAQPQRRLSSSLSRTPARFPVTRSRSRSRSRR